MLCEHGETLSFQWLSRVYVLLVIKGVCSLFPHLTVYPVTFPRRKKSDQLQNNTQFLIPVTDR